MNEKNHQNFLTEEYIGYIFQHPSQHKRQSFDPLDQLAKTHQTICDEAADAHELAAHLEALGYNKYRAKQEFGINNTFELASEIYRRTNRQIKPKFNIRPLRNLRNQQLVLLVAVVATMIAFLQESINWGTMLWIISWSFMGNYIIAKASTEWSKKEGQAVLAAILYTGLLGFLLLGTISNFEFFTLAVTIFWWAIAGWAWRQKIYEKASILSGLMPSFLLLLSTAGMIVFNLKLWPITCFLMLALALFLARHELIWPKKATWSWIIRNGPHTFLMGLYGLGQGLLLMHFIKSTKAIGIHWSILGLALCTALIIVAEHLVIWLKSALTKLMWSGDLRSRKHFRLFVETIILRYSLLPALVLLVVVLIASYDMNNDISKYTPIIGFVLFGVSLSFALALINLSDTELTQISFAAAGLLSLTGLSPSFLLILLVILLFGRLLIYAKHIEQYGISLL